MRTSAVTLNESTSMPLWWVLQCREQWGPRKSLKLHKGQCLFEVLPLIVLVVMRDTPDSPSSKISSPFLAQGTFTSFRANWSFFTSFYAMSEACWATICDLLEVLSIPKYRVWSYWDRYFRYSSTSNATLTPSFSDTLSRTICSSISTIQNPQLFSSFCAVAILTALNLKACAL